MVDDVEFNLHILKIFINQTIGVDSDLATNGEIAIEMVIERFKNNKCCPNFDFILMDIEMPVINGIEATKLIL